MRRAVIRTVLGSRSFVLASGNPEQNHSPEERLATEERRIQNLQTIRGPVNRQREQRHSLRTRESRPRNSFVIRHWRFRDFDECSVV